AKMTDLPCTVCVLQFADDILVSGETEEDCEKASVIVCNVLAETGFKASREKLQWVRTKVTYLGHVLMQGLRAISTDRVQLIRKVKSPRTIQQLQSFLGLINYCRQWIPDCAIHDGQLRGLIDHKAPPNTPLEWTAEADEHFNALKAAITTAPALGLPDYTKPFHLHVRETVGAAMGVLLQIHGSTYRPVAYLSKKLASHQVGVILHNMQTQHMTAQRRSGYEATLLATKNLSIQTTANINPALLGIFGYGRHGRF
ncbi:MAG: RNase H-like domain-containing protein, partial [Plesiomonas sp.]|uniref:ribonuclease H family protein n=1 Tax=Plesiomonas sp. TaxID=2486279 RepID=UPI003F3FB82D